MFGRSALASTSAAASLALILLAAAGCKIQVGSLAQASSGQTGAGPSGSPGVTRARSGLLSRVQAHQRRQAQHRLDILPRLKAGDSSYYADWSSS